MERKAIERKATIQWNGDLQSGKGKISTESTALTDVPYSYGTRFESLQGTNPEELIAAAHAACFSMALSHQLGKMGLEPESIQTTGAVTIEQQGTGWTVTGLHLEVSARVPGADQTLFETAAADAKAGCPISRLLKAPIRLTTELLGSVSNEAFAP